MAFTIPQDNPFATDRRSPSLSWKNLPVGATFKLEVLEPAKLLQSRDFLTQKPKFWEDDPTRPVMSAVVNVRVLEGPHSVGEERSIWAQKPSDLFSAIAQAQQDAQDILKPGGILHLRFAGETPHPDPRMNNIKNYLAKYEPPKANAFSQSSQPQAQAPQPAQQSWGSAAPTQPTAPRTW